ncbi:MAG: hypothetical protein WD509_01935 [Candidatus Paceibacterota bacterium]
MPLPGGGTKRVITFLYFVIKSNLIIYCVAYDLIEYYIKRVPFHIKPLYMNNLPNRPKFSNKSINPVGKQSVRTTFKLHKENLRAMEEFSSRYEMKPKEVFDLLCTDEDITQQAITAYKPLMEKMSGDYVRKTYVISKSSKNKLNKLTRQHNLNRDTIVNVLLYYYKQTYEKLEEREKQGEIEAQKIISEFEEQVLNTEKHLKKLLSEDNPIIQRFGYIAILTMNLVDAIHEKIENCEPIDPDRM